MASDKIDRLWRQFGQLDIHKNDWKLEDKYANSFKKYLESKD